MPRASARSKFSTITTHAPSEITPESLVASYGRLACWGSSLASELSPADAKEAIASGVTCESAPPAIATSTSPDLIRPAADAIASMPDRSEEHTSELQSPYV